jgi:hypothetical protein
MKSGKRTIELAGSIARSAGLFVDLLSQNYTPADRRKVSRGRRTDGRNAKLLNYSVSYLNEEAYQMLLREIFFKGEYRFETRRQYWDGDPLFQVSISRSAHQVL